MDTDGKIVSWQDALFRARRGSQVFGRRAEDGQPYRILSV